MTDEIDSVLLTDGNNRVLLHPPSPYADGHGFHHRVDLAGGPFHGTIEASSYEPLVAREGLVALHQSSRGEASLPNSYENLRISLKGDGLGHIVVEVEAHAVVQGAERFGESLLTLNYAIDQAQLPMIIKAIERWIGPNPRSDS